MTRIGFRMIVIASPESAGIGSLPLTNCGDSPQVGSTASSASAGVMPSIGPCRMVVRARCRSASDHSIVQPPSRAAHSRNASSVAFSTMNGGAASVVQAQPAEDGSTDLVDAVPSARATSSVPVRARSIRPARSS